MDSETATARPPAGDADGERALGAVSEALRLLSLVWGDEYLFGYENGKYWAARRQAGSGVLRAGTPEELGDLCAAAEGAPS